MELTRDEVMRIAQLARIKLTEEEVTSLASQLSNILGHIAAMQEVDTSGVPISASVLPVTNVMRADAAEPSLPIDEALANTPEREDNFARVKAVLE